MKYLVGKTRLHNYKHGILDHTSDYNEATDFILEPILKIIMKISIL